MQKNTKNLKKYYRLFITNILLLTTLSCQTTKPIEYTPIIIWNEPVLDISDDSDIEQDFETLTIWAIKIKAYVDELINQIKNKAPYFEVIFSRNSETNT